jgi:hypothetical protein
MSSSVVVDDEGGEAEAADVRTLRLVRAPDMADEVRGQRKREREIQHGRIYICAFFLGSSNKSALSSSSFLLRFIMFLFWPVISLQNNTAMKSPSIALPHMYLYIYLFDRHQTMTKPTNWHERNYENEKRKQKFRMALSGTLKDLKGAIAQSAALGNVPVERQRIFYLGRELKTSGRSLHRLRVGVLAEIFVLHLHAAPAKHGGEQQQNEQQPRTVTVAAAATAAAPAPPAAAPVSRNASDESADLTSTGAAGIPTAAACSASSNGGRASRSRRDDHARRRKPVDGSSTTGGGSSSVVDLAGDRDLEEDGADGGGGANDGSAAAAMAAVGRNKGNGANSSSNFVDLADDDVVDLADDDDDDEVCVVEDTASKAQRAKRQRQH